MIPTPSSTTALVIFRALIEQSVCGEGLMWNPETAQCENPCPADLTGDYQVDVADLLVMLGAYASFCPERCAWALSIGNIGVKRLFLGTCEYCNQGGFHMLHAQKIAMLFNWFQLSQGRILAATLLLGMLTALSSAAQAPFVDVSNEMDIWTDHTGGYLGVGLSMADFNGDGLDDLSIAHHEGELQFYLGNGVGFTPYNLDLPNYPNEAKCILWADIDNDGDQDLFITYRLAANKLYINQGDLVMTDVSAECGIDQSIRRSYGACFGDYDNDGLLDLFIANYVSGQDPPFNEFYRNLGGGYFEEVTFDFPMGEPLLQNFQGQWVDFDEDGLLDLNLIRDRLCFENKYYKQTEDGDFFNDAHEMGLDYAINAMCTATTDFDRDNDQDLYISAGIFEGNHFVVNDGTGVFELHDPEEGDSLAVNLTSWAGTWLDMDNDGWEDLHVCTGFSIYTSWPQIFEYLPYVPDNFFHNEGGVFYEDSTGFFDVEALSFAAVTGDFNLDGFPDLVKSSTWANTPKCWKPFPTITGGSKSGLKAPSATATASAQRFASTAMACSDTI